MECMSVRSFGMAIFILCLFPLLIPPLAGITLPDPTVQHHAFARSWEEWEYLGDHTIGVAGVVDYNDALVQSHRYSQALWGLRTTTGPRDSQYYTRLSILERKHASTSHRLDALDPYKGDRQGYDSWAYLEKKADAAADEHAQQAITLSQQENKGHLCLIVTATFGSPLASEVQLVRDYRDGTIQQSYTGSQFFMGFNAWYYSFSPAVADYIATHPLVKSVMQVCLVPLLEIVLLSQNLHAILAFSPELATVSVLLFGAAFYSLVYIFPPAFLTVWLAARKGWKIPAPGTMRPVLILWILVFCGLAAGIVLSLDLITIVSSGLLVASTIILIAGTGSLALMRYLKDRSCIGLS